MMNEDEFYTFAQSADRGSQRLNKTQACEEWLRMLNDDAVLKQSDKGITLLEVSMGTFVNRDHAIRNLKVITLKCKEDKRIDESAIAGIKKKMLRDHDRGYDRGEEADFEGIAKGLVANPSSNKFAGAGAFSIDVQSLLNECDDDQEDEPAAVPSTFASAAAPPRSASAAGDPYENEEQTRGASNRRKFDRNIAVTSGQRVMNLANDKIQAALLDAVTEIDMALTTIEAKGPEESTRYAKEVQLAKVRLVFAKAVLAPDANSPGTKDELATLIAGAVGVQGGGALGTGSTGAPCRSFATLMTMERLRKLVANTFEDVDSFTSQANIDAAKDQITAAREPCVELIAACRQAAREIMSAISAFDRMASQQAKKKDALAARANAASKKRSAGESADGEPAKKKRTGPTRHIFDFGLAAGTTVVCFSTHQAVFDAIRDNLAVLDAPFIVSKQEQLVPTLVTEIALPSFLACWSSSPERAAGKRVAMAVTDKAIRDSVLEFMVLRSIPDTAMLPSAITPPTLEATLAPSFFAVPQGTESAYNEPGFLASVRLQVTGTRTVVATPCFQLLAWLGTARDAAPSVGMSMQARLWHQLLNMQQEAIVEYTQSQLLIYGTLGPGDSMFVPPGWLIAESVAAGDDCVGVRASAGAQVGDTFWVVGDLLASVMRLSTGHKPLY